MTEAVAVTTGDSEAKPAPLPTRERQRLETRRLIFEAALEEISIAGLGRARIEDIARKAGVTRPTVYAHFPAKEDILRELQTVTEKAALSELKKRLAQPEGKEFVHRFADAIFDIVERADPTLRREVFALIIREPRGTDWIGNELFGFLTRQFGEAQARGELSSRTPAQELTRTAMNAIFGFLAVEAEDSVARRRGAHQLLHLLITGAKNL